MGPGPLKRTLTNLQDPVKCILAIINKLPVYSPPGVWERVLGRARQKLRTVALSLCVWALQQKRGLAVAFSPECVQASRF